MIDEEEPRAAFLQKASRHNMRSGELIYTNVGSRHANVRSAIDAVKADRGLLRCDQLRIVTADALCMVIVSDAELRLRVPGGH